MSAGSVGLRFVLNSAVRASAPAAIHQLYPIARSAGSKEVLVYTDSNDVVARMFYIRLGFQVLGPASDHAPGKTMADSDIALRMQLDLPGPSPL
jgi:hypothetical protein